MQHGESTAPARAAAAAERSAAPAAASAGGAARTPEGASGGAGGAAGARTGASGAPATDDAHAEAPATAAAAAVIQLPDVDDAERGAWLSARERGIEEHAEARGGPAAAAAGAAEPRRRDEAARAATDSAAPKGGKAGAGGFASREYWDNHYETDAATKQFEWLEPWAALREPLLRVMHPTDRVLHVGIGNSTMAEEMHDDAGFVHQLAVDFSAPVVASMAARSVAAGRAGVAYAAMDVRRLALREASFDAVLDKATLDALVSARGAPGAGEAAAGRLVAEAQRVLRRGGAFVCVSFGAPSSRLALLRRVVWAAVDTTRVCRPGFQWLPDEDASKWHWIYVCTK